MTEEQQPVKPPKKKKTVADWDQMLFPLVNRDDPPRATRHLSAQTMCGACMFKCCNSEIFTVELTPAEAEKFQLPLAWPQNGRCHCLTEDSGCKFGNERPSFCKIYPVQINFEHKHLYQPNWARLHCPGVKHFEFVEEKDGKYIYKKRTDIKGPVKNNVQDLIELDFPIEQWPTILEQNKEGLEELYGEGYVDKLREQMKVLKAEDEAEEERKKNPKPKKPDPEPQPVLGGFDLE